MLLHLPLSAMVNFAPWPTQLVQASAGLAHILEEGYDPANITLAGDSVGGLQVVYLLGHLLHPHPDAEPIRLQKPLAGAVALSAWLSFSMDTDSFKHFGPKDVVAPLVGLKQWSKLVMETRTRSDDGNYLEPAHAPASWWTGLESVAGNVLLTAGGDEGMIDDIVATLKKMEEGAGKGMKLEMYAQEGVPHNEPFVDFAVGDEPGATNLRVLSWIKDVYA